VLGRDMRHKLARRVAMQVDQLAAGAALEVQMLGTVLVASNILKKG